MFCTIAVLGSLAAVAAAAPVPADRVPERSPLFLSVGIHAVHAQRVLPLDGTFPVILTNVSDKPVKVWREWCSWGFYNVSLFFEIGGKSVEVSKVSRGWSKNYPDAAELAPGESIVFSVSLTEKQWEEVGFLKDLVGMKVKMRARYRIKADEDSEKLGVWDGSLDTEYREYTVEKPQ